jgi:hypothetical protein
VAHRNVPFRDFFEHHGPAFPALLAPVVALPRGPYAMALAGRALMSAAWAGLLLCVLWPRPGGDPLEGPAAAVLLAFFGVFALKSVEIRPDVPAALLVAGAAAAAARRRGGGLAIGALLGLALWFSPKALFPAAGLLAAAALRRARDTGPAQARRFLARAGLAGAGVGLAGLACFASLGALGPLWDCYVSFNGRYRRGAALWSTALAPSLALDPLTWGLGLWGLALWRRPEQAGTLAGALVGCALSPSPYPHTLLFVAPPLAALAAAALADWVRASARPRWRAAWAALVLAAALARPAAAQWRAARAGNALQRERWACVEERVGPGERVLDIWGGDSFHRPHAAWMWFLPDDSQAMFDPAWLEGSLGAALAQPRTRGLIWCESCFARMPASFVATARRLYRPAGCGRLWLRKESE